MKIKITFIIIIVFAMLKLNGQAVISVQKNNVLYAGIENPIAVAVPGVAAEKIQIFVNNGKISKKIDNINYLIIPKFPSTEIRVFSINGKDTINYSKSIFRVKKIPMPDLFIANINLSKEAIIRNRAILRNQAFLSFRNNLEFELKPPVIKSFVISYVQNNEFVIEKISGYRIPNNIIVKLLELPENTQIIINNIVIKQNYDVTSLKNEYSFILL